MPILVKVVIGAAVGLAGGALLGYYGKCSSGSCPLTANPYRGALIGLVLGALVGASLAPGRTGGVKAAPSGIDTVNAPDEFDRRVLAGEGPVLVKFFTTRCPACRRLAPTIKKLAARYEGRVDVLEVDGDQAGQLVERYGISAVPTVLLFNGGKIVGRWVGVRSQDEYEAALDKVIAPGGAK